MLLRVLLVEDSPEDAELTLLYLRRGGYEVKTRRVDTAADMEDALQTENWDIIISDYSMPQFNAPAALAILKAHELDIPFIIVSGTIGEETAVTSMLAGANDFLVKGRSARLIPAVERELREAEERRSRKRAEEELARAEERFTKAFQLSPNAITITTMADGRYIDVNESFLKLIGYRREEVIGKTVFDLNAWVNPDDRAQAVQTLTNQGEVRDWEVKLRTKIGEHRETTLSLEVIQLEGVPCLLTIIHDITDRKQAERAIRESEERFRLLAENSTDMISRHTPEGVYLYVSPACYSLLGYESEALVGRSLYEFLYPDDLDAVTKAHANLIELSDVHTIDYRIRRKDGTYIWFETTSRTIRNPQTGHLIEIQAASRDVSERKQAEETLRRSEERFRLLVQGVQDYAVYLLDPDGRIASWNAGIERLMGYQEDDILGEDYAIFFIPEDQQNGKPHQLIEAARSQGHAEEEYWRVRKDGSHFWADVVITTLWNDDGSLYGYAKITRDLTQRKQAEEKLKQYNQRLNILHNIDQAILTAQPNDTVAQFVFNYYLEQSSISNASIVLFDFTSQTNLVLTPSPDRTAKVLANTYSSLGKSGDQTNNLKSGEIITTDDHTDSEQLPLGVQQLHELGSRHFLRMPLMTQDELIGVLNLASDEPDIFTPEYREDSNEIATQLAIAIQQYRLREQIRHHTLELEERVVERTTELQRAKERVEAILNNSGDAILFLSHDAIIQQINPAFRNLFGYEIDDIFGQSLLSLAEPSEAETLLKTLQKVVNTGQTVHLDFTGVRQNGSRFDADMSLATVYLENAATGLVCSLRDITKRKQAELSLRQALEHERELSELKSRFTSMVSHEFRTPLTVILASTNMLQYYYDELAKESRDEYLQQIQSQVEQLSGLLNDILTLDRAKAINVEVNAEEVDLVAVGSEVVAEIQLTTSTHHIEFVVEGEPRTVQMDSKLMRQAINNLLANAVKYSPSGGSVRFELRYEDTQVILHVQDWGIGIPKTDQARLFEIFHRASNVGAIPGTGLGLPIVKRAVEAHNGEITVDSKPGAGTIFTITLPY